MQLSLNIKLADYVKKENVTAIICDTELKNYA
jgi:hypothetical protein